MNKARKSNDQAARGGRPKGAENIERPTAIAAPAHCPRCGGTRYRVQTGSRPVVHEIEGVSKATGEPYRYVVWRNVVCACGQHFRIREETSHDPREVPF